MEHSFKILHFSSFYEISVSYKTPSSQRRHFETHLQPTVNVTAHCNTLAAFEHPHELHTTNRLAEKIISKDMNCTCVIVHCLEGLRVRTVWFEGKHFDVELHLRFRYRGAGRASASVELRKWRCVTIATSDNNKMEAKRYHSNASNKTIWRSCHYYTNASLCVIARLDFFAAAGRCTLRTDIIHLKQGSCMLQDVILHQLVTVQS